MHYTVNVCTIQYMHALYSMCMHYTVYVCTLLYIVCMSGGVTKAEPKAGLVGRIHQRRQGKGLW